MYVDFGGTLANSYEAALHDKWISAHAAINWGAFSLGAKAIWLGVTAKLL